MKRELDILEFRDEVLQEWREHDPYLEDVDGFREFFNKRYHRRIVVVDEDKQKIIESHKIRVYGSKKDRDQAVKVLSTIPDLLVLSESDARLGIQTLIDEHKLKADILYKGNSVWSKDRILRNLRRILKVGALAGKKVRTTYPLACGLSIPTIQDYELILSKYFYSFLTLCCGSIAHYNIYGWVGHYSDVEALREFFRKNEYGQRVLDWIPGWKTDAKRIVEAIEVLLEVVPE